MSSKLYVSIMGNFALKIKKNAAIRVMNDQWSIFKEVDISKMKKPEGLVQAFHNNLYSVQVYNRPITGTDTVAMLFGIRAHVSAMSSKMTWAIKQRIKNEIAGKERFAFEVYPPVSELIDEADMYWMWVMPAGEKMPFKLFNKKKHGV